MSAKESVCQVLDMGVRGGIDLCIRIAQSPYITKEMFLEHVRDVVVRNVKANQDLPGCQAKRAITFCDNCSCQCSDDILQELANYEILLITYPPHSSRIFHVLDVMLFDRLKSASSIYHTIRSWIHKSTTLHVFSVPTRLRQQARQKEDHRKSR
jgi:hypothetical protein